MCTTIFSHNQVPSTNVVHTYAFAFTNTDNTHTPLAMKARKRKAAPHKDGGPGNAPKAPRKSRAKKKSPKTLKTPMKRVRKPSLSSDDPVIPKRRAKSGAQSSAQSTKRIRNKSNGSTESEEKLHAPNLSDIPKLEEPLHLGEDPITAVCTEKSPHEQATPELSSDVPSESKPPLRILRIPTMSDTGTPRKDTPRGESPTAQEPLVPSETTHTTAFTQAPKFPSEQVQRNDNISDIDEILAGTVMPKRLNNETQEQSEETRNQFAEYLKLMD